MTDEPVSFAMRLIDARRTMVLAAADPDPWAAPVYYHCRPPRFYFFSSPKSIHVSAALSTGRCAAAIFRDSDDWREIEGLQMDGHIERIDAGPGAVHIFAEYVARFPTVRSFFDDESCDLTAFNARFRTELHAFVPARVFYLNNRAGFGNRTLVQWPP